jgi:uncharacterized damage-inducible protein DinB
MSPTTRWFDRTFETGHPESRLSETLERLHSTPDRIDALLTDIPPEVLARRSEGKWSILENVGHLHDLESLSERRLDDFAAAAGTLSAADLENRATWDANHNARPPADVMAGFRNAREHFVHRVRTMPAEARGREITHPRLQQPMRVVDLAFFMAEHDDHHIGRLRELLAAAGHAPA